MTTNVPAIDLENRVLIVTGASVGLGKSMAKALARAGARVVLASPQREKLEAVAAEIESESGPGRALVVRADITQIDDCRTLLSQTLLHFGALHGLINNARREHRGPGLPEDGNSLPFWKSNPEIWMQTLTVNVGGTFLLSHVVAPHLIAQRWGRIVNVSTSVDTMQRRNNSPYGVTKAAIDAASLIWAQDLIETGVTVNILLPGGTVDTDGTRVSTPERRYLPVDSMDEAIVWLASTRSDGKTGGRYVGRLWDTKLSSDEAAAACMEAPVIRKPEPRKPSPRE
jgi:NAD(P)-dependent dehydrogenase (short-subunit alcohol dehydrogenase family)